MKKIIQNKSKSKIILIIANINNGFLRLKLKF